MKDDSPLKPRARLRKLTVSLPFSLGSAEWSDDESERQAAWSLYVELATRISTQPLGPTEGLLREALSSLHALFPTTREILKATGPRVAIHDPSVGRLAIQVLNRGLRPFLARWHPELLAWEAARATGVSPKQHEESWERAPEMRSELALLRTELNRYAEALRLMIGLRSEDEA